MDHYGHTTVVLNARHADAWRRRDDDTKREVIETTSAAEGRERARAAAEAGAAIVIAAGGDGTIQSVAAGLLGVGSNKDERPVLGIAALGHGNDLARALSERPTSVLDVGRITVDGSEHHFVNSVGIGLEGRVARAMWRALPRGAGYTVAALRCLLFGRRRWSLDGTMDGAPFTRDVSVLSVGNGRSTGGGYRVTPEARTDDGRLDFCAAAVFARRRLLGLMRKARRGQHLEVPGVESGRFRTLTVRSEPGVPVHADGEVLAEAAHRIEIDLLPAALRVR